MYSVNSRRTELMTRGGRDLVIGFNTAVLSAPANPARVEKQTRSPLQKNDNAWKSIASITLSETAF